MTILKGITMASSKKDYYAGHQKKLLEIKKAIQENYKKARIFERTTGEFLSKDGKRHIKVGKKGEADLQMFYPTKIGPISFWIEVKTGNAKPNKDQRKFKRFVEETLNGVYIVGREPDQVIEELHNYFKTLPLILRKFT